MRKDTDHRICPVVIRSESNVNTRELKTESRLAENSFFTICWRPVEHFGQNLEEFEPTPSRTFLCSREPSMFARKPETTTKEQWRTNQQIRKICMTISCWTNAYCICWAFSVADVHVSDLIPFSCAVVFDSANSNSRSPSCPPGRFIWPVSRGSKGF